MPDFMYLLFIFILLYVCCIPSFDAFVGYINIPLKYIYPPNNLLPVTNDTAQRYRLSKALPKVNLYDHTKFTLSYKVL
jgi:hypothetical protein